jgi:3-oxoacyl-[acyl-carrier protein] reductase
MNLMLKDKAILVTGSSRGIGKSIALELGREGAWVGVTHSGSAQGEQSALAVATDVERLGGKAKVFALNVGEESQVESVCDAFVKSFGRIDGLVNNAGITADGLSMRYKTADWDRVLNVNLRGAFLMSRALMRPLMKADGASIVNMSSVVGQMGNPGQVAYTAAKAGLIGMTKSLARELGSRKVRVNAVAPGFIETDMTDELTPEQKNAMLSSIPLQSFGKPEDIAAGVLFLLSPRSQYISGQVLGINGGMYM